MSKLYCSLHQMFQRTHSPPIKMSLQRAWPPTLWLKISFKQPKTSASRPKTTLMVGSAGPPGRSLLMKSWRLSGKLTAKAGTSWWVCPTPAASGAAAKARSAPFAEGWWMNACVSKCFYALPQICTHTHRNILVLFNVCQAVESN